MSQYCSSVYMHYLWYYCSTLTMCSLRRANLIKWTPYADDCMEILSSSPEASESEKFLCQWFRIQHIAEDIGTHFSTDDPPRFTETNETKIRYAVKGFETQLQLCVTKSNAQDSRTSQCN